LSLYFALLLAIAQKDKMTQANYLHPFQNQLAKGAFVLLILIYTAGVIGLAFPASRALFQDLTPFSLWTSTLLLILFQENKNRSFLLFAIITFLVGYFSEVLGVHTGLIFGDYSYGATLGFKLWEVPILIGANWLILVLASGYLANSIPIATWLKPIIAALLMVGLDVLIEPVAVYFDFWSWAGGSIPFKNYIGWFAISLILQILFFKLPFTKYNFLAGKVFFIQLFFFLILRLLILFIGN
jgi:hypothetical protein